MEKPVSELIESFIRRDQAAHCEVSVVGDVMLDEYHEVTVSRISPEFPIPVMKSRHDRAKTVPGGAANVAIQFQNFNTRVYLTGITGQVMRIMPQRVVKEHSPHPSDGPIPIKKRFYQGDFPIARWDIEEDDSTLRELSAWKFNDFELKRTPVTIFSDYNKGLFKSGWHKRFLADRLSVVDPKSDLDLWTGCTVFKPNSVEAKALTGESDWRNQATALKNKIGCRDVVITQGGEGVVGLTPNGFFEYSPTRSSEVNSVIGAGDCFVAMLGLALSHGFTTPEAASIAFEAGAIYVQAKHNRPLKPAELLTRKRGERVVFTNGCFDILHAGHIHTLEFAKRQGDILVVGVNTDASVKRLKGDKRPINSLQDRIRVLEAMKCVDGVVPFAESTPIELIRYVRPDVIVKGGDYRPEDVVGHELAEVVIAPTVGGLSTTHIIERSRA